MKILQVNCVYKKGSTGKIVYDIHTELQNRGHESIVCYGRGIKYDEAGIFKTCPEWMAKINSLWSRISGVMYGSLINPNTEVKQVIKREKPDVVHLHCINAFCFDIYDLVNYLKVHHIPTLFTLHAEFIHTANCGHAFDCEKWKTGCGKCPRPKQATNTWLLDNTALSWKKMKESFDGFEDVMFASVSPWLMNRAKQSPILADKQHTNVLNGLDTKIFSFKENNDVLKKFGISHDRKVVFHATPYFSNDINNIKGGYYLIKLAKKMPDILFVVAGPKVGEFEIPHNMVHLGKVSNQNDLACLYSAADATILTSRKETFSMITAESLCCGTPIVGFKAGAPEGICIPEYSRFVEFGDVDQMASALREILSFCFCKKTISAEAVLKYAKENMVENYINLYKALAH